MDKEELLQISKPILFNTGMVWTILEGRKTVRRQCVKYKYDNTEMKMRTDKYGTRLIEIQKDIEGETYGKNSDGTTWRKLRPYIEPKPPYKKGDYLYVRETWQLEEFYTDEALVRYKAGGKLSIEYGRDTFLKLCKFARGAAWIPSIHMPKKAARIFLRVTDVRVERLQDISEEQAINEGCDGTFCGTGEEMGSGWEVTPIDEFSEVWDSTIKKVDLDRYRWDANPWVWVIEFERVVVD